MSSFLTFSLNDFDEMFNTGLFQSINFIYKVKQEKSSLYIISYCKFLNSQQRYLESFKILSGIDHTIISSIHEKDSFFQILIECCKQLNELDKLCEILNKIEKPGIYSRKLDYIVAKSFLERDNEPRDDHPSIPFLLRVYNDIPYSIEVIELLVRAGGKKHLKIENLETENPMIHHYIQGLILKIERDNRSAIKEFEKSLVYYPACTAVLNEICKCAAIIEDDNTFCLYYEQVPNSDPEIIHLKAEVLKRKNIKIKKMVQESLNYTPNSPYSWIAFSSYLEMVNSIEKAKNAAKHAKNLDRYCRASYMRLGDLYFDEINIRIPRAVEYYAEADRIYSDIDSLSKLFYCARASEDDTMKITYAAKAERIFPNLETFEGASAGVLMAVCSEKSEPNKACAFLKKILEKNPKHVSALEAMINIYISMKKYDEAIDILEKYKHNDTEFFYCYMMGYILIYKGHYGAALDYMNRAHAMRPYNTKIYNYLSKLERSIE